MWVFGKSPLLLQLLLQAVGGLYRSFFLERIKTPLHDERDKLIWKNAHLAGFGAVYLYIILMSFLPIGILGEEASIPVIWCPGLLIGAGFCQVFAQSLAILIQYGWGGKDGGK
jgi:hypothetical protein